MRGRPTWHQCILACAAFSAPLAAQPRSRAVYVELAGNAGLYSVNLEHLHAGGSVRLGVSAWSLSFINKRTTFLGVPALLLRTSGHGPNKFEYGAGVLAARQRTNIGPSGDYLMFTGSIGYLRRSPASRIEWRYALTPFFGGLALGGDLPNPRAAMSSGLGVGWRF